MPRPLPPANHPAKERLADQLAVSLGERIKGLSPGTKLPSENQLATDFKVSRTVVREAISHLNAIGALRTQHGSGNYVASPSTTTLTFRDMDSLNPVDIIKFFEIRSGLDAAAARLAAMRRTKVQLTHLRDLCRRTMDVEHAQDAAQNDVDFHLAIVKATANEHMVSVHRFLNAQIEEGIKFTRRLIAGSAKLEESVRSEHQAIFDAIAIGDSDKAAQCALDHMTNSQKRLRDSLAKMAKSVDFA